MNTMTWMDRSPLSGVFFAAMAVVLLSLAIGFWLTTWRRKQFDGQGAGDVGAAVGAMLGLLAFILAFTFGMTASRFDTRRQLLLDEVNAIGTAILRADLLPEPYRTRYRELLTKYVNTRANPDTKPEDLPRMIAQSEDILDQLWAETEALAKADMDAPLRALFVQSLNEVIDLHTSRVTVGRVYRVPGSVWLWLGVATVVAMLGVGYQFGSSGKKKILIPVLLAVLYSSVVLLIADLDRAAQGTVRLNLQPMVELQKKLNDAGPASLP